MSNMDFYNKFRAVPPEAQKEIKGGRISGMTDINPMWRLKALTETFGPCGIGWYYEVVNRWLETGANNEISAFVEIHLFFKHEGEWSKPVYGVGGNSFVASQKNGLYTSDECFKMALTDALSVACKALGVGADIYFAKDRTKYTNTPQSQSPPQSQSQPPPAIYQCADCAQDFEDLMHNGKLLTAKYQYDHAAKLSSDKLGRCKKCREAVRSA